MVVECLRSTGRMGSYQTKREGERVFLVQRCHNSYGTLGKLVEYGTRTSKGIIVILEGGKWSGWAGFVRKIREMAGFQPFVSVHIYSGGATRDYRGKQVVRGTSSKGASSSREVSYLSALLKPVAGSIGSHQNVSNGAYRKDGSVRK